MQDQKLRENLAKLWEGSPSFVEGAICTFTDDGFPDEPEALRELDSIIMASALFSIERECVGEYIHPRHNTNDKEARIDRILIPTQKAIDAGWNCGAVGFEGKKSGTALGPMLVQAIDYTRCLFVLSNKNKIMLDWIFCFPVKNPGGDIESVMLNNRIGCAYIREWDTDRILKLTAGSTNVFEGTATRMGYIKSPPPFGKKRGSR